MTEGWIGIIRSCYPLGALPGLNESNGCHTWFNPDLNFSALYCFCDTDYCNAASTIVGGGPTTDIFSRLLYGVALLAAFLLPSSFSLSASVLGADFESRSRSAQSLGTTRSNGEGRWRQRATETARRVVVVRREPKSRESSAIPGSNFGDHNESMSLEESSGGRSPPRFVVSTGNRQTETAMTTSSGPSFGSAAVAPFRERGEVGDNQTTFLRQYKHFVAFARFFKMDTGCSSRFHPDLHRNVVRAICADTIVGKERENFKGENIFSA